LAGAPDLAGRWHFLDQLYDEHLVDEGRAPFSSIQSLTGYDLGDRFTNKNQHFTTLQPSIQNATENKLSLFRISVWDGLIR